MSTPIESTPRRVVAIVGRPNVGKSALFNRILGQRVAIVHEESGVTRDRIVRQAVWNGELFEIIDTGGLAMIDAAKTKDEILCGIHEQAEVALVDAAVVILVTDLTAGVTPLDQDVARKLHQGGRRVFVAANKADSEALDGRSSEFGELGFPVFPVSAIHNRGVADIMSEVLRALPPQQSENIFEALKVAIVGRPNVGKSSYVNRLLGSERVIVSEIPGTTRDSIEIPFVIGENEGARHYLLIDTAGMRKPGRIHEAVEKFSLMRAEKSIEQADVVVLMLDAEQGPTVQDKKIAAMILEYAKGCVLVVNKWDLADGMKQKDYLEALRKVVPFLNYIPIIFVSSKSGLNIRKSVDVIDAVAAQITMKLPTGVMNRLLQDAFQRVQPPMVGGRRLKLYYATQVTTKPVRVKLFVNDPHRRTPAYESYLIRILREAFGLEGAPVFLLYRSSHEHTEGTYSRKKSA